ncbi:MAG: hypothetical protein V4536_03275 [Pseudomonadota bacterium]|jgi:5-carboxymethyl-2-hydroxymuconate isomerase
MPHITVEIPPVLQDKIDWNGLFKSLHINLANAGYGRLDDFKSRTVNLDCWQVSDKGEEAVFLFATLQTMNPRPPEMLRAMGGMIYAAIEEQARQIAGDRWLQVCVKVGGTSPEDYFKGHINAPDLKAGKFKVGEAEPQRTTTSFE